MRPIILTTITMLVCSVGSCCESYEECMKHGGFKTEGNFVPFIPEHVCLERVGPECRDGGMKCGYVEVTCPDRVQRAIAFKLAEIEKTLVEQDVYCDYLNADGRCCGKSSTPKSTTSTP